MSVQAMTWAFAQQVKSKSAKLVLLALADRVNKDSAFTCYPGLETLAKDTSLSRRAVVYALKTLMVEGLISRERRYRPDGFQRSNLYRLHVVCQGCKNCTPKGCKDCTPGVQNLHPNSEPERNLKTKGILEGKKAGTSPSRAIEVPIDSEQGKAWRRAKGPKLVSSGRFTYYVASEWPPDHPNYTA